MSDRKIIVNGKEVQAGAKRKVPRSVDWQALARAKQEELAKKEDEK
jgi:hypothetical protein